MSIASALLGWQSGLALHQARHRYHPGIVVIGGSHGKTNAKSATSQLLNQQLKTLAGPAVRHRRGLNFAAFGVAEPGGLIGLASWFRAMTQTAVNGSGGFGAGVIELDNLWLIPAVGHLKPELVVITGAQGQGSDKWLELAKYSQRVLFNADDPALAALAQPGAGKTVMSYGMGQNATISLRYLRREVDGSLSGLLSFGQEKLGVNTRMISRTGAYGLLAAIGIGLMFGQSFQILATEAVRVIPAKGRMNPLPGANRSYLIDDSFSSDVASLGSALQTLSEYGGPGRRRIAVVGGIRGGSAATYQTAGQQAAACADLVVAVGAGASTLAGAAQAVLGPNRVRHFSSASAAGSFLHPLLQAGDVVLIKGSQGSRLENITRLLLSPNLSPANVITDRRRDC